MEKRHPKENNSKYEAKEKERQNMRNRTSRKIHQEKRTKILKIKQQKFQRILNYIKKKKTQFL